MVLTKAKSSEVISQSSTTLLHYGAEKGERKDQMESSRGRGRGRGRGAATSGKGSKDKKTSGHESSRISEPDEPEEPQEPVEDGISLDSDSDHDDNDIDNNVLRNLHEDTTRVLQSGRRVVVRSPSELSFRSAISGPAVSAPQALVDFDGQVKLKIPKFDGTGSVECYTSDARYFIKARKTSNYNKIQELLWGLSDIAKLFALSLQPINSPEQLIEKLNEEFRPKGRPSKLLYNLKQSVDEDTRHFAARVRKHISYLGYLPKNAVDDLLFAGFSMGLRPEIQKRVEAKDPRSLKRLLEVAAEIEAECPPKKAKTKDTELTSDSVSKSFVSNEGKLNMIIKSGDDLQKQVTTLADTVAAMQNSNNSSNYRNLNYSNNNRSNHQQPRNNNYRGRPALKCFICGKDGHKYMNCQQATWEQRFAMRNQTMNNRRNFNDNQNQNNNGQSLNSNAVIPFSQGSQQ